MNELASPIWREADTQEREMLNLLVWAPILSEDEMGTELRKEYLPTSQEGQALSWTSGLIEWALRKLQEEEEKKNGTPTSSKTRSRLTSEG